MKKFNKFLIPALALGLFAACSDDNKFEGPGNEPTDATDPCYVSVDLSLANSLGGRANTGNEATEIGQDYENQIHNAVIVLAEKTSHKLIAAVKVDDKISGSGSAKPSITAKFSQSEIETYRNTANSATPTIEVFALCNCSSTVADELTNLKWESNNDEWIEKYATYTTNDLSINNLKTNGVFMTSKAVTEWTLPTKEVLANTSASSPANVGTITVQRTIARFDYADGSEGEGTYTVYDSKEDSEVEDNDSRIKVKIIRVGTLNISSNFWNFPHFANDADGVATAKAFSTGTLVADYNGKEKDATHSKDKTWVGNNYFSTLFNLNATSFGTELNRGGWESVDYSSLLSGTKDSWNDKMHTGENTRDYRIWRYVTENVIPVADNQINGLSTGIVFKGQIIIDGEGDIANQFKTAMNNKNTLYVFSGSNTNVSAIGGISDIIALGEKSNIYAAMEKCLKEGKEMADATDADVDKKKATAAGFTMYEAAEGDLVNGDTAGEYYMYYYYWNRHIDNDDNSVKGPMEFATVRNNVYKLSLTKISKFGHPRKPENDPDPLTPETPDEDANAYITVSLVILPWDVRVNDIEF